MTPQTFSMGGTGFGAEGTIFGENAGFMTMGTPYPAFTRADGAVFDQYGNPYVDPLQSIFGVQ